MSGSHSGITHGVEEAKKQPKRGRSRSRDVLEDTSAKLAKVDLVVADGQEKFEVVDQCIDELEKESEELRGELQGALNQALSRCLDQVKTLEEALHSEVGTLKEELERVSNELKETKDELALCKKAIAQSGSIALPTIVVASSKVDVPRPKAYNGSRNAKEVDNFLWSLEQYFKALGITEDTKKIDSATLYLMDTAMVWWRRRYSDIERGTCIINTWDEFKKELKRQFYPENAEEEARAKLRRL